MVLEVKYRRPTKRKLSTEVYQIDYFESDKMPGMDKIVHNLIALGRKVIKETVVVSQHRNTAQYIRRIGFRVPKI